MQDQDELSQIGAELGALNAPAATSAGTEQGVQAGQSPTPPPEGKPASASDVPAIEGVVITRESATDMATSLWTGIFDEVQEITGGVIQYSPETRQKAINKTVPVVLQYQAYFPDWLKKHWAALDLGLFVGGVAYGSFKAYLLAKREVERLKQQQGQNAATQAAPPQAAAATPDPAAGG